MIIDRFTQEDKSFVTDTDLTGKLHILLDYQCQI